MSAEQRRHPFIAGALTGALESTLNYPLDYVKVQLQLSSSERFARPLDVIRYTMAKHGVLGFYRGLSCSFFFALPTVATRFTAFEAAHRRIKDLYPQLGAAQASAIAGLAAGLVEAAVCNTPMETVQVQLMHDQASTNPRFHGMLRAVPALLREYGPKGLYRGVGPLLVKVGSQSALRFGIFAGIKHWRHSGDTSANAELTAGWPAWECFLAGATAGAVSVACNHPVDVVKTNLQGLNRAQFRGAWHCFSTILRERGVQGLYRGMGTRMLRVSSEVGLVFLLYERISAFMDKQLPF